MESGLPVPSAAKTESAEDILLAETRTDERKRGCTPQWDCSLVIDQFQTVCNNLLILIEKDQSAISWRIRPLMSSLVASLGLPGAHASA